MALAAKVTDAPMEWFPAFVAVSRLVHFTEQFTRAADGLSMTFDYQLRPGLATSSNAIRLMEIIGFEIPN